MQSPIIVTTFVLGAALLLVAVVALFTRHDQGRGTLKFVGIEISGTGAPALFLLVGTVLVLSGFGWATSEREVAAKDEDLGEVLLEVDRLDESLEVQELKARLLMERLPATTLDELNRDEPGVMNATRYRLPPEWSREALRRRDLRAPTDRR